MEDKNFDDYIKKQLAEQQSPTKGDWNAMHQKLVEEDILHEETNISNEDFDNIVKEQIEKVSLPFNSAHWLLLREKLLTEKYIRRRLAVVKSLELALLFLLFWTVVSVVPFKTDLYAVSKYRPNVSSVASIFNHGMSAVKQLFSIEKAEKVQLKSDAIVPLEPIRFPYIYNETSNATAELNDQLQAAVSIDQLPLIAGNLSVEQRDMNSPRSVLLEIPAPPSLTNNHNVVTLSTGLSSHKITTPFTKTEGLNGQNQHDFGQHVDMTFGYKNNRVEIFTGVGLYSSNYDPKLKGDIIELHNGIPIEPSEISDIGYKFVTIPLGMRYYVHEGENWSAYAIAGINISLLAEANYGLTELSAAQIKLLRGQKPPNSFTGAVNGTKQLRAPLDSNLSKGILQGGSVLNNLNTTATIGFGVVRKISKNLGIFIQPSYTKNFSFDGLGAQDEEINNVRLDLGVRVSI